MIKKLLRKVFKPEKPIKRKSKALEEPQEQEQKQQIPETQFEFKPIKTEPVFNANSPDDVKSEEPEQFFGLKINEQTNEQAKEQDKEPQAEETLKPKIDIPEEKLKVQTVDERVSSLRNKVLTIAVGIIGLLFLAYSLKDMIIPFFHKKAQTVQEQKAKLIEPPKDAKRGEVVNPQALEQDWKTLIEKRISEQDKALTEITKKLDDISDKLQKKEKVEAEKSIKKPETPPVPPPLPPQAGQAGMPQAGMPQAGIPVQKPEPAPVFRSIEFKKNSKDQKQSSSAGTTDTASNIQLPMGITVGITLTGMDAPTFQWGQQEPQPMLISIESPLITAGGKEIPLKNCMLLTSGYGAVSSEKAMLRAVSMNCRDAKGNLYAGNVEGWVLGDDGKVGITGRLVSRQGSALAKAFWADVLSLGGSALRASATSTQISALGTVETTEKTSDIWKSAAGQAVERTTNRIAQFFIKIAEQIYPVIEVQPGRKVTILIKHGSLSKVTRDNFATIVGSETKKEDKKEVR